MAYVVDWNAVAALGTWVVGIAAAAIAWQAHCFSSALGRRQRRAEKRRLRAYSIAAYLEMRSLRQRAEACATEIDKVISDPSPSGLRGVLGLLASMPSFFPSAWIIESPSIGDLPKAVSTAVSHAVAAASEASRMQLLLSNLVQTLPDAEFVSADGITLLKRTRVAMSELMSRGREVEPLLSFRVDLSIGDASHAARLSGNLSE